MTKLIRIIRRVDSEAYIWLLGLAFVAYCDPYSGHHFTLCLFKNLGFDFCPGCGLGRSIALLVRGDILASFRMHPLGGAAIAVLLYRVALLFKQALVLNDKEIGHDEHTAVAAGDRER